MREHSSRRRSALAQIGLCDAAIGGARRCRFARHLVGKIAESLLTCRSSWRHSGTILVAVFAFTVLSFDGLALGADYYVDSISGNDGNIGLSELRPWKTIAKVNSTLFEPRDVVHLRCGAVWREMLKPRRGGAPGAPITFTRYGTGPQPIINGSDVVTGWQLFRGSIFSARLATEPGNVYVDGGPGWGIDRATSLDSMSSSSWFWESASKTLYIWLEDGKSPEIHNVEAAVRISGFYANVPDNQLSYTVIDGLTFERTRGYGIYFHSYAGVTGLGGLVIRNCMVTQTGTGRLDTGRYLNGIMLLQEPELRIAPVISGNHVSYTGGHGNGINSQGADESRIEGNDVSAWNHNGIDVKHSRDVSVVHNVAHDQRRSGAGFYCEYITNGTWAHNQVYNTSNGFQIGRSSSATVSENMISQVGTGVYFGPEAASLTLKHNVFRQTPLAVQSDGLGMITDRSNDWGRTHFRIGPRTFESSPWAVDSR